jgi:hypothetical protein
MALDAFWQLISHLGGEVTDESLDGLRGVLRDMSREHIRAFQARLDERAARLAEVELRYPGEGAAVGDGRLALVLAVIAAGPDTFDEVLASGGGPVDVPLLAAFALELDDVAREAYEDKTGEPWPEPGFWESIGAMRVVTAYFPQEGLPHSEFVAGAKSVTERWQSSSVYAQAVRALGYHAFWCLGTVYDPKFPEPKRGTRWWSRAGDGAIKVNFFIDHDDLDDVSAEAGERFVCGLIDKLAKRWGLPGADETLSD